MTVRKMIEALQKQDPDARVMLHNAFSDEEVLFVLSYVDGDPSDNVWLSTEEDYDMKEELTARLNDAIEKQLDELDFYSDLLEDGVNVDMVKRYLGEEQAVH